MENMFRKRIKELREYENITQEQLGKVFDVTKQTVSKWEAGLREPNYDTLVAVAKHFGVTSDYLLGLED